MYLYIFFYFGDRQDSKSTIDSWDRTPAQAKRKKKHGYIEEKITNIQGKNTSQASKSR